MPRVAPRPPSDAIFMRARRLTNAGRDGLSRPAGLPIIRAIAGELRKPNCGCLTVVEEDAGGAVAGGDADDELLVRGEGAAASKPTAASKKNKKKKKKKGDGGAAAPTRARPTVDRTRLLGFELLGLAMPGQGAAAAEPATATRRRFP